jgi:ABC-2 type transport system ATP-binding protein
VLWLHYGAAGKPPHPHYLGGCLTKSGIRIFNDVQNNPNKRGIFNMTTSPILQTFALSKSYGGGRNALSDLSLRVEAGEVFGYLGPNGAGKTTTIRLLLDLIRPSAGRAEIFGLDVHKQSLAIRQQVGFLPGELNLWRNLTAKQTIAYFGKLRGQIDWPYVQQLAERLSFDLGKQVRSYSTGNKRKLGLILAFMHKPKLLILDEPTSGLDPLVQQTFIALIQEAKQAGQTVFLSSHVLSEVQAICQRVAILRDGELKAVRRIDEIIHNRYHWITLGFRPQELPDLARLKTLPGLDELSQQGDTGLRFRLNGDFDPVLRAIGNCYVTSISSEEPSLEEIFLKFYGDKEAVQ